MMRHKPLFITFEGCEGAGKSTLARRVFETLQAKKAPVLLTREPGGTAVGEKIRELLLKEKTALTPVCELFLFLAARAQHLEEVILKNLKDGTTILCDRFSDSTIAYQGAGRGMGVDYVTECNRLATKGIVPDLTLYVDLEPRVGLQRVTKRGEAPFDRFESEKILFHERVRASFLQLAKTESKRFHVLDGTHTPEQLEAEAIEIIEERWR